MLDHDALGLAGRAGCIDHIRQVFRPHLARRVRVGLFLERTGTVEGDGGNASFRQERVVRGLGDDGAQPRVFHHVRQPVLRISRVERNVRRTGLEDRQHPHDQFGRAIHEHTHQCTRPDALADQMMSDLIRPGIQFCVADLLVTKDESGGVGRLPRLRFEQVMYAAVALPFGLGAIPFAEKQLPLLAGEDRQLLDAFAAAKQIVEEGDELPFHPRERARVEFVLAVAKREAAAVVGNDRGQFGIAVRRWRRRRRHSFDRDGGHRLVPIANGRADAGVPQRYVQRVRSAFAKQRQLFEQGLPECAEVGARVDGDAQRDVRRKQSRALGAEAFEPFMPEGDREFTLAADPREIREESSEQRVARRRFETRQERCRGCHLLRLMARPRSHYCTPPDEGDLDRLEVGEAAQPEILMLADARSQRAQGTTPIGAERLE